MGHSQTKTKTAASAQEQALINQIKDINKQEQDIIVKLKNMATPEQQTLLTEYDDLEKKKIQINDQLKVTLTHANKYYMSPTSQLTNLYQNLVRLSHNIEYQDKIYNLLNWLTTDIPILHIDKIYHFTHGLFIIHDVSYLPCSTRLLSKYKNLLEDFLNEFQTLTTNYLHLYYPEDLILISNIWSNLYNKCHHIFMMSPI